MSDTIQGIAILDDTNPDGMTLHCVCVSVPGKNPWGEPDVASIAVSENPPAGAAGRPVWKIREDGQTLHCQPSLKITTRRPDPAHTDKWIDVELFHNTYHWSVRFVRWSSIPEAERAPGGIWHHVRQLNAELFPKR